MENKVSVIASTEDIVASIVDESMYISREIESMKLNYPNLDLNIVKCYAVDKYNRDKAVFDSVIEGETKLYKRIYLFGDSVTETHSVIRKFVYDNRFCVETISPWMLESEELDIQELFTKEEL